MEDEGVLGIVWWDDEDGVRHYGCRGTGPKYRHFYIWAKHSSYRNTSSDWPWDYFVFDDPADHDRLIREFPKDVWEDAV